MQPHVSIILPTYNESQNILEMLHSIRECIPHSVSAQTIVVDDNSPDGTGRLVEEHKRRMKQVAGYTIEVIHRRAKAGLGAAILQGIGQARGETIVVMDSDMSHPPHIIPKLLDALRNRCDIAVASRYIRGGRIDGWPARRKIMSWGASAIARNVLGITTKDPMSGFFAFRRNLVEGVSLDGIGFKILMEMLVKLRGARITEIPYTFQDRRLGSSKMNQKVVSDYFASVWRLYRHGGSEPRGLVRFLSKAARFYTVGAIGFLINYITSLHLTQAPEFWYLHANIFGIVTSMTSNFLLNKVWTFQDHNFGARHTITQYAKFAGFSSAGAAIQLGIVYSLVEGGWSYPASLVVGVLAAALGNFLSNKKWTFGEKIWG